MHEIAKNSKTQAIEIITIVIVKDCSHRIRDQKIQFCSNRANHERVGLSGFRTQFGDFFLSHWKCERSVVR